MPQTLPRKNDDRMKPNQALILKYEGEDDHSFFVSEPNAVRLAVPKNRSVPKPFRDQPPQPLTPAFHLLAWAFVGLAPAGLGALVLAPLAALWALAMLATRPLTRSDRMRVIVVWGIAAVLLGIAILMSTQLLAHFSVRE